jgi:hypothetical protein
MSGNRANASAVQRRTNNPPPVRNTSSSSSRYNPPQPVQPQSNPKLSVSDAIALITIRLGRVETFINQLPPLDQLESFSSSHTEESSTNMSLVNDNVFQSIVTRLEKLEKALNTNSDEKLLTIEKEHKLNIQKISTLEQLISSLEQKLTLLQEETHMSTKTVDSSDYDNKIISLNTQIDQLKDSSDYDNKLISLNTQIDQLKDTILSLQTYTMNTNTKLIDLIVTNTEMNDNQNDNEEITKHLENLFRHNFENLESENGKDIECNTFEDFTNEESNAINQLTLDENDLSNLSINI